MSVTSGKKKASVRKETVAVSATKPMIVRTNQNTAATLSEPTVSRCRSVSRKGSIRGQRNHGSILRQSCRCYLKGTCTRTSCEYWHPPECQFYKNETGCKAGDKCLFPHYNVDEQLFFFSKKKRKRATSQKEEKATIKWVVYHKIQMHSFLKVESLGETRCRRSWHQFKGYDSPSQRYVMRVSGKRKDNRWEQ